MKVYLESVKEVGGIYVEAAQECFYDARKWLGRKIAEIDEWACDYGDE